jgi:hypothetical protein
MTSRRSPLRRSSGSRAAGGALALAGVVVLFVVPLAAGLPRAAEGTGGKSASPLTETRDGVEIDWAAGTLTAPGGAAADLRMPGADIARAGAVRRAEVTARAQLGRVLAELPLGGGRKLSAAEVARAVGRARTSRTEYQMNGGALVWITGRFGDWSEAAPEGPASPAGVLTVASMHLAAAPLARLGEGKDGKDGKETALGAAVYRSGAAPHDVKALAAKVDRAGRLVIDGPRDRELAQKLARGTAVIYVGKVLR